MNPFESILRSNPNRPIQPIKRKIFVSYHHGGDQAYCDWLTNNLGSVLEVFADRSLNEPVRSNDPEYVNRRIREDYIKGSSVTVVLCGAITYKRKYVDWEIKSTLDCEHALLGISLPNATRDAISHIIVPNRLCENIHSGYAHWVQWNHQSWLAQPRSFIALLEEAIRKSGNKVLIRNSMQKMEKNSP